MRKIYCFSILIGLYSTQTKAQEYSYAWHGEQLNAELRHPQVIGNYGWPHAYINKLQRRGGGKF